MPALTTTTPRRLRSAAVVALLLLAPLLTGCLRAQLTMGVAADDQVSGLLVLAVPAGAPVPTITAPPSLVPAVSVAPYDQGGFVGSQVTFTSLSFGQLQQLSTSLTSDAAGNYTLVLRRSGDIVSLDGAVDLTNVTQDNADISVRINFPDRVNTTNGTADGVGGVAWSLADGTIKRGQRNLLQATVGYADPNSRTFRQWTIVLGGVTLGAVLLVAVLAVAARDRSPRPGRARR